MGESVASDVADTRRVRDRQYGPLLFVGLVLWRTEIQRISRMSN